MSQPDVQEVQENESIQQQEENIDVQNDIQIHTNEAQENLVENNQATDSKIYKVTRDDIQKIMFAELPPQMLSQYEQDVDKSQGLGNKNLMDLDEYPKDEYAVTLLPLTQLYHRYFKVEKNKFYNNLKYVYNFFMHFIQQSNSLYVQRLIRYKLAHDREARNLLVNECIRQFLGQFQVFNFQNSEIELGQVCRSALQIAVFQNQYMEKQQNYFDIFVKELEENGNK